MKKVAQTLVLLPLMLLAVSSAHADQGELDHENQAVNQADHIKDLPPTLIIRVDQKTKAVDVVHMSEVVNDPTQLKSADLAALKFTRVNAGQSYSAKDFGVAELDRDNSRESWYFSHRYFYPYAYPTYYYPVGYPAAAYSYYPTYTYYGASYAYYPYAAYATPAYSYYYYSPYVYYRWRRR